jgi:hypothetical protein
MAGVRSARKHAEVSSFDRGAGRQRTRMLVAGLGMGIAAAIAIAFIMIPSLRNSVDARHAGGTMTAPVARPEITSEIPITGRDVSGTIRTTAGADQVTMSIAPDTRGDREVRVVFDTNVLSLDSFTGADASPLDPGIAGVRSVRLRDGIAELRFARRTGEATAIALKISGGQDEVFETVVNVGQSTNF